MIVAATKFMLSSRRSMLMAVCAMLVASSAAAQHTPVEKQIPCEAYSQSAAVFVGVAGPAVMRRVQLPDHPPIDMKLTPMTVEHAYVGVSTPMVYLTPLGTETYATPGKRSLVYGRAYRPPDIVMASPGIAAKEIEHAAQDLAFLETLTPGMKGGIITGVVQHKAVAYDRTIGAVTPLERVRVRIFQRVAQHRHRHRPGRTFCGVGSRGHLRTRARVAGRARRVGPHEPNPVTRRGRRLHRRHHRHAVQRTRARRPARSRRGAAHVDERRSGADGSPGQRTHRRHSRHRLGEHEYEGKFEFAGRPAGRYYLGVSLYNAPNPSGPSYPRTYYPGTTDRASAVPIVIEPGRANDNLDFTVPMILPKGQLEVIVDTDVTGELKLCYIQLEDVAHRRISYRPQPGTPFRLTVVDGQRYEIHVHVEFPGGHLESEPFVFVATTAKTVVRLRPDAPRRLHKW